MPAAHSVLAGTRRAQRPVLTPARDEVRAQCMPTPLNAVLLRMAGSCNTDLSLRILRANGDIT
jgi:hypothetical protein